MLWQLSAHSALISQDKTTLQATFKTRSTLTAYIHCINISGKHTRMNQMVNQNDATHFVILSVSHLHVTVTSPVTILSHVSVPVAGKKVAPFLRQQITASESSRSHEQLLLSSDRLEMGSARARKTPDWVIPWSKEGGYRFRGLSTPQRLIGSGRKRKRKL